MSNIVIAFSKPEVAAGIKKILTQSGYSVQAVCTTGAQALASVNNLECGILICGCRFMDMMYMEIHDYLPPEFQMLLYQDQHHYLRQDEIGRKHLTLFHSNNM